MKRVIRSILLLVLAGCSTQPQAPVVDAPAGRPVADVAEEPIGTLRITATRLKVRETPDTTAGVIATLRKGEKVSLLSTAKGWHHVRLGDGKVGWVSAEYAVEIKSCPADRDFRLVEPPMISFMETDRHGMVTVEADVSSKGEVTRTRVIGNTTGESALASIAEKEIRSARFSAPVKNCRSQRFIYVYRKTF